MSTTTYAYDTSALEDAQSDAQSTANTAMAVYIIIFVGLPCLACFGFAYWHRMKTLKLKRLTPCNLPDDAVPLSPEEQQVYAAAIEGEWSFKVHSVEASLATAQKNALFDRKSVPDFGVLSSSNPGGMYSSATVISMTCTMNFKNQSTPQTNLTFTKSASTGQVYIDEHGTTVVTEGWPHARPLAGKKGECVDISSVNGKIRWTREDDVETTDTFGASAAFGATQIIEDPAEPTKTEVEFMNTQRTPSVLETDEETMVIEHLLAAACVPEAQFTCTIATVRALVLPRLRRVQMLFPQATHEDLCEAMVCYSPESKLFEKGYASAVQVEDVQWDKYQGGLYYGSDQAFHDGAAEVLGETIPHDRAMGKITTEIMEEGDPEQDRFNLWYIKFCPAVEQKNFNDKGDERQSEGGASIILDEGHGGMRLQDFKKIINTELAKWGSKRRVTDANVLSMRMYTASSFRRFNKALRDKGMKTNKGQVKFRACIQSARQCISDMQAIPRPAHATFRGVTGYLADSFQSSGMGMDYAFFSTTTDGQVARDFAGTAAHSVVFEIEFIRGCPGADISMLSLFPGEKEVIFPPCTGLSLKTTDGSITGESAGQANVIVTPNQAN
jgi:hypothetical protein